MKRPDRLAGIAFLLAVILLLVRLGELPLVEPDEGRNARVAWEMKESGAWFVPTYNGLPYLDKPACYFKAVAVSFSLFGRSAGAARLPSALCGVALLGVIYLFSRGTYGRRTAVLAILVTASMPLYLILARTVIFDLPLALFVSLSIMAVFRGEESGGRAGRMWHLLGAAAAGVATLIKGPVGFLLPGLVNLSTHLPERKGSARNWGFLRRAFSLLNLLVFFAVTLPWFFVVLRQRPDFGHYGLVEETLRRYSTTTFHRTAPFYYYLPVILGGLFPWSLLLPESAVAAWRTRIRWSRADRLCLTWAVVVVVFFSTSQSKLPGYILSATVPAGILIAHLLDLAWSNPRGRAARVCRHGTWGLAVFSVIVAVLVSLNLGDPGRIQRIFRIRSTEFDRLQPLFLPLTITFVSLSVLALLSVRWRRSAAPSSAGAGLGLAAFLLFPFALLTVCFGGLRGYAEAASARGLVAALGPVPAGCAVACLECFPTGLPFYLDRPVTLVTRDGHEMTSNYVLYTLRKSPDWPEILVPRSHLASWLSAQSGPVYLLTRRKGLGVVDSLARVAGAETRPLRSGWWTARLPAAGER